MALAQPPINPTNCSLVLLAKGRSDNGQLQFKDIDCVNQLSIIISNDLKLAEIGS